MVYPPQEVCSAGTAAIQQFLCRGEARLLLPLRDSACGLPLAGHGRPGQEHKADGTQHLLLRALGVKRKGLSGGLQGFVPPKEGAPDAREGSLQMQLSPEKLKGY